MRHVLLGEKEQTMAETNVSVQSRSGRGKGAAKRLRRSGRVPAVVYGGPKETLAIELDPKAIYNLLRSDAGRNTILTLDVDGAGQDNVILKDWQVDPVMENILHADFQRIAMDQVLRVTVPIVIRGEAIGVKAEDGLLDLVMREVGVECLPADIPERIECDVSNLHLHESVRVGDLPSPDRVQILDPPDGVVAHVVVLRIEEEETEVGEGEELATVEGATEGEPEVMTKGKKEDEGGE